jgi:hypothetical protein
MYARVEKSIENRSRAVTNSVAQKKSNVRQGFGFVDNRPETIAQKKLQEKADSSPHVKQLRAFQEMANNHSTQQKQAIQKKGNNVAGRSSSSVVQRVISIGGKVAGEDVKSELITDLKALAITKSVTWRSNFELLLEDELKSDSIRKFAALDELLNELITVDSGGAWKIPQVNLSRTMDQARDIRQQDKFHRTHELNPSQANPLATGFHSYDPEFLLQPPEGIRLAKLGDKNRFFREKRPDNPSNFQIYTTGNPAQPGYIYQDQGEFAGNLDQYDTTKKWSRQKRKQDKRKYMDMGTKYKWPQHTVGHVQPFEHSPLVHDKPISSGPGPNKYLDSDSFGPNTVIENPVVGEQIKRSQVEREMMMMKGAFMQYPTYSSTSPIIPATYNSKPVTPGQTDSDGLPVKVINKKRPDKLAFSRNVGTSDEEWAEFDNTGKTRYDTQTEKRKKTGYDERTDLDWEKWTGKRVRKGMSNTDVWGAEKQTTPFPYKAEVFKPSSSTTSYEPWLDSTKTNVPGYTTPPRTPYYLGPETPSTTQYTVDKEVFIGQEVTATDGTKGRVIKVVSFDSWADESTVVLEPIPDRMY